VERPIIEVKNLVKRYGDHEAVRGISFQVMEGEIFGLLGPNGAGKSSTLEIMETLRDKTSGEVTIGGYSLDKDPAAIKSMIGVQLQTSGFYPGLKLTELIGLFNGTPENGQPGGESEYGFQGSEWRPKTTFCSGHYADQQTTHYFPRRAINRTGPSSEKESLGINQGHQGQRHHRDHYHPLHGRSGVFV
jgi:ABC-type dipeptide/oligopeptide/nickel transport system ATPase component